MQNALELNYARQYLAFNQVADISREFKKFHTESELDICQFYQRYVVDLKAQINDLQGKLEQRSKVQYIRPSYWVVDGEKKDGPFCQKCYDVDGKLVRLYDFETDAWECKECDSKYYGRYLRGPAIGSCDGTGD